MSPTKVCRTACGGSCTSAWPGRSSSASATTTSAMSPPCSRCTSSVRVVRKRRGGSPPSPAIAPRAIFANVDAISLYRRALQAAKQIDLEPHRRAATLAALGDVEDLAGLFTDARRSYTAARRLLPGDPIAEAEMFLKTAFVDERLGRFAAAVRTIRRGLRALEGSAGADADDRRAELLGWYAAIRVRQGRFAEAADASEEAIRLAAGAGESATLARALMTLDYARNSLGDRHRRGRHPTSVGDLHGPRRHRRRGDGGERARQLRVLRRPVGRSRVAVPALARRAGAHRGSGRRRHRQRQPGRDPHGARRARRGRATPRVGISGVASGRRRVGRGGGRTDTRHRAGAGRRRRGGAARCSDRPGRTSPPSARHPTWSRPTWRWPSCTS